MILILSAISVLLLVKKIADNKKREINLCETDSIVLYLKDGTQHKFNGPRTSDGLKEFVNSLIH